MNEKQLASSGDSFVGLTEMQTGDLLNKLSDENTRLHKKVDEQQVNIEEQNKEIEELSAFIIEQRKENKRLNEEIEQLKQSRDRFVDTVAKQVSLLIELRKENEQLRKQVAEYEMILRQHEFAEKEGFQ